MPSRAVAILGSLAITTALVGTGVGIAGAADGATTRTLHFSEQLSPPQTVSKGHIVILGTLTHRKLSKSGKLAGYDTYACQPNSKKAHLTCNAAFTLAGGIVFTRVNINYDAEPTTGLVTGGDGIYRGARGTVTEQIESTGITIVNLTVTIK